MKKLCECGCGKEIKPFRRFISGHNFPMRNPRIAKEHGDKIRKYHDNGVHREQYLKQWRKENRESILQRTKERKRQKKIETLSHYGNGECACIMCGYDTLAALTLDHINNDGYKERRSGHEIYHYLIKNDFLKGYQTLCMNCQYIKREAYENNKSI